MPIDDALEKIQVKPGEEFKLVEEEKEEIIANQNQFRIIKCDGWLSRDQLEILLKKLPIKFVTVDKNAPTQYFTYGKNGYVMDVYHFVGVISIYPLDGKRLHCASLTNMDFPIRPDNIMDDTIGLRCCFHPKLSSFGIQTNDFGTDIEIDIYKSCKADKF